MLLRAGRHILCPIIRLRFIVSYGKTKYLYP
jgi:hypothetical protein